jgi:hypothetical protein
MGGAVSVTDGAAQDESKTSDQVLMQHQRKPREGASSPAGSMVTAIWDKTKRHPLIQSFPGMIYVCTLCMYASLALDILLP